MADLALQSLSDHDLILLAVERIGVMNQKLDGLSDRLTGVESRVSELEKRAERQAGFWAGANWLKQMIVAAPPAVIAFFLGKGDLPA